MVALLHGTDPPHPIYSSWIFAEVAKQQKVRVPQIHLLIGNRLTQFEGSATAFAQHYQMLQLRRYMIYTNKIRVILLMQLRLYQQRNSLEIIILFH